MFNLVAYDLWYDDGNFHCLTNNALYGDKNTQAGPLATTAVLSFRNFNLKDIFFRNAGAAANTTIIFVGVEMAPGRKEELGVSD